jgi:hypothetical protein
MSNDLALLEEKIHQLPPNLIVEVDSFVNELLQKYRLVHENNQQQKMKSAKQFLKELRPHCFIGDVISPLEEQWDVMQ